MESAPSDDVLSDNAIANANGYMAWAFTLEAQFALLATSTHFVAEVLDQPQRTSFSNEAIIEAGCGNPTFSAALQFIEVVNIAAQPHTFGSGPFASDSDLRAKLLIQLLPVLLPHCASSRDLLRSARVLATSIRQRWLFSSISGPPLAVGQKEKLFIAIRDVVREGSAGADLDAELVASLQAPHSDRWMRSEDAGPPNSIEAAPVTATPARPADDTEALW